jgi:hypothetical protein
MQSRAGLVLLVLLLSTVLFFQRDLAVAEEAGLRAHVWTLPAGDWSEGTLQDLTLDDGALKLAAGVLAGVYVSPVGRIPFAFTGVGVHMDLVWPEGAGVRVQVRLRSPGGAWGGWQALEEFSTEPDGRTYSDDVILAPQGSAQEIQLRVHLSAAPGKPSPRLRDVAVVAIDGHAGPTAAEAQAAARRRSAAVTTTATAGVPQPPIITRAEWGANESLMEWPPEYQPVDKMILHHTVSGGTGDPATEIRTIYYYHAVTRGWGDIGYNFVLDRAGNIYEGRYGGLDVEGAHTSGWNSGSMGMSVLGCYDSGACSAPMAATSETLSAIADLMAWQSSRQLIDPQGASWFTSSYTGNSIYMDHLAGHRDYGSTSCPGDILYGWLPHLRPTAWERLPEYEVRFGWHDTPATAEVGQILSIHPNLYNAGRLPWRTSDGFRLGYRWLRDGIMVLEDTAAAALTADVPFGEMTALVGTLTVPAQPGRYTLRWDMYRDGIGWFSDVAPPLGRSTPLDVAVEVESVEPQLQARFTPPAARAGTGVTFTLGVTGAEGASFETLTQLPPDLVYAPQGTAQPTFQQIYWAGTLEGGTADADFRLVISTTLALPAALPVTTTLNVPGFEPLELYKTLLVNGHEIFLPTLVYTSPEPPPDPDPVCWDLMVNGGFETQEAWLINPTPYPADYSTEQVWAGNWSMRLGIPPGIADVLSYSSVDQTVSLPGDVISATLRYALYPVSSDLIGDRFDLLLNDGEDWYTLAELRSDAGSWLVFEQDLTGYAGQTVTLRFRVFNDGSGGQAAAWLDEVVLEVCVP